MLYVSWRGSGTPEETLDSLSWETALSSLGLYFSIGEMHNLHGQNELYIKCSVDPSACWNSLCTQP